LSVSYTVDHHLGRFEESYRFGENVRRLFRSAGCDPIFAAPTRPVISAPPHSWVLHVRLTHHLEDSFGFTRQFVVFCTDVADLRSQQITQLKRLIATADHPVATDFAVLVTADPRGAEKLIDWSVERSDGIVVLHIHAAELGRLLAERDPASLLPLFLERAFSERNLYDDREPVSGDRFFGRTEELRELDRVISQGNRHVGIFGLRRIGKTSLLYELRDRLRRRPEVAPIFLDLELSSAAGSAAHVAHRVADAVARVLSERGQLGHKEALRALSVPDDWEAVPPKRMIADLGVSLVNVLTHGALQGTRLVLILDEAEVLLPTPATPVVDALDFLRMIRGVSQETRQLTLVLAGVNATPVESPVIGEDDNPLFGLLAINYLGPLESVACSEMIRTVGRKMRIRWQPAGVGVVTEYVGAHPLLARLASSEVAAAYPVRPSRPNAEMVNRVLAGFTKRNSDIFVQMVHSLAKYYPDELEILRLIAAGDVAFARDLVDEDPGLLNHLVGYGVLERGSLELCVPALASWLRETNR
jgi:hypothetical protein